MQMTLHQNIALIGLMGAGKTTIGKRLSHALGAEFYDSDHLVVERIGMEISDVFAQKGEAYFRQLEREIIADNLVWPPHILATGGGAYIQEETRHLLQERAVTVWLKAEFEVLLERVSRKNTRPLLEQGDKAQILRELMEARYPLYEQADITIESDVGPHEKVVQRIIDALKEKGYIDE